MNNSNSLNEKNDTSHVLTETGVVSGTVKTIGDGEVLINFGENKEAIIPLTKFEEDVQVGNIVTFRLEEKNEHMVITEILTNKKQEDVADDKNVVEGLVLSVDEDVLVNVGLDTDVKIPSSRFTDIEPGDKVKMRVSSDNGNIVVTEVISRIKKSGSDVPFTVESHETEKPKTHQTDENGNVKAKIRGYNYTTDVLDVEILDDTHKTISFKLGSFLPNTEFGKEITVLTILNLELTEDGCGVRCAQIDSTPNKMESIADSEHPTDDEPSEEDTNGSEIDLRYIDKDFLLDCMSVPTHSELEYRMVAYIIMWAKRNNIYYEFDEFGNVYLTKGELDEGEYYPCVTSHLDTVQSKHDPYIYAGVPLELKVSEMVNQGVVEHKVSVNNEGGSEIGIGADDKGGICICLSMFEHLDKLKACFFLDEERGCHGSDKLDEDWFKNVGYVIGFDSPDLYRAAWACDGTQLFDYKFYEDHIKKVCDSWGLTKGCFFSEPYTDVKNIREKTELICMNFGNGGYNAHNIGGTEYCIMEHMDQACGMGVELVEAIGNTKHVLKHNGRYTTYRANNSDILKLEELGDDTRVGYTRRTNTNTPSTTSNETTNSSTPNTNTSKEDDIKFETVKYIVERYDSLLSGIKEDVLNTVKSICESNNIDFKLFEESVSDNFSNDIKF